MINLPEFVKLFDFYAPLLTDRQRDALDLHYNEDLSLAEIAENMDITRQGVHDAVVIGEKRLIDFEEKVGAVEKLAEYTEAISRMLEYIHNGQLALAEQTGRRILQINE